MATRMAGDRAAVFGGATGGCASELERLLRGRGHAGGHFFVVENSIVAHSGALPSARGSQGPSRKGRPTAQQSARPQSSSPTPNGYLLHLQELRQCALRAWLPRGGSARLTHRLRRSSVGLGRGPHGSARSQETSQPPAPARPCVVSDTDPICASRAIRRTIATLAMSLNRLLPGNTGGTASRGRDVRWRHVHRGRVQDDDIH